MHSERLQPCTGSDVAETQSEYEPILESLRCLPLVCVLALVFSVRRKIPFVIDVPRDTQHAINLTYFQFSNIITSENVNKRIAQPT